MGSFFHGFVSVHDFSELAAVPIEGTNLSREATIIFPSGIYRKASVVLFLNSMQRKTALRSIYKQEDCHEILLNVSFSLRKTVFGKLHYESEINVN